MDVSLLTIRESELDWAANFPEVNELMNQRAVGCANFLVAAVAVFGLACGSGEDPEKNLTSPEPAVQAKAAAAVDASKANADSRPPVDEATRRFNLRKLIQKQKADLRKVPGRVGLLGEKKLYSLFDEEFYAFSIIPA